MTDNFANQLTLAAIRKALKHHSPELKQINARGHAAVAMLLRESNHAPEALFIIRAKHDDDPWSGNIGFPGGRLNQNKETPQAAAERETREELNFDPASSTYLGQLDDLYGAIMPVLVSCFVYHVEIPVEFTLNHEVESAFWCPLPTLLEKERHQQKSFLYRGKERTHPAVVLLKEQQPLLWGITYRLVRSFFTVCGHDFGGKESDTAKVE